MNQQQLVNPIYPPSFPQFFSQFSTIFVLFLLFLSYTLTDWYQTHSILEFPHHHFTRLQKSLGAMDQSMEAAMKAFDTWQPQVDHTMDDLKLEVSMLNKQLDHVMLQRPMDLGLLVPPLLASARASARFNADKPVGNAMTTTTTIVSLGLCTHPHSYPGKGYASSQINRSCSTC